MRQSRLLWGCGMLLGAVVGVLGKASGVNVVVTLRGKRYEVKGASSVSDIQEEVEKVAGLAKDKQALLFKGRKLAADDQLSEAGVSEGDTINVVPNSKKAVTKGKGSGGMPAAGGIGGLGAADGESEEGEGEGAATAEEGGAGGLGSMMGGMGMPNIPGMPDLDPEQYQQLVQEMLQSPVMDEFLNDPEKIEQSRQAILNQPQLKDAMKAIPGFTELIEDPEKWRESMQMAKDVYAAQREMLKSQTDAAGGGKPSTGDVDDLDDE